MNKASEDVATSSQDAQRQMQNEPTVAEQSKKNEPAPSSQSPDRTAGTVEQTRPAPTEHSKKMTAGEAEQAPSQQKVDQDCD
jgi:hypothetical protein